MQFPDDYRDLIQVKFDELKKDQSKLTFGQISKKIKTSRSYLALILKKHRHLGLDRVFLVSDFLKCSLEEKQYLLFSVLYQQTEDEELKKYFLSSLQSLRSRAHFQTKVPVTTKNLSQIQFYTKVLGAWAESSDFSKQWEWLKLNLRTGLLQDEKEIQNVLTLKETAEEISRDVSQSNRISNASVLEEFRFQSYAKTADVFSKIFLSDSPSDPDQKVVQLICALDESQIQRVKEFQNEYIKNLGLLLESFEQSEKKQKSKKRVFAHFFSWVPLSKKI